MRIEIAERLHPFCHLPGTAAPIPGTEWCVQAFPTRLVFRHLHKGEEQIVKLPIKGPVRDFTLQLDLEKGFLTLFGFAPDGFFRYFILPKEGKLSLFREKGPLLFTIDLPFYPANAPTNERLSLGMHKSQDWELVKRRCDMKEVFPCWFRFGSLLPFVRDVKTKGGTPALLQTCRDLIEAKEKLKIVTEFSSLFQAGFSGILTPRLTDDQYLGLAPEGEVSSECSPLILLTKGSALIRSLFLQENEEEVLLLPCLPPEFSAGRMTHVRLKNGDTLCFEWTKKLLRRLIWQACETRTLRLGLQSQLKSFRLRRAFKEKGHLLSASDPLYLRAGETIYLDRFQK